MKELKLAAGRGLGAEQTQVRLRRHAKTRDSNQLSSKTTYIAKHEGAAAARIHRYRMKGSSSTRLAFSRSPSFPTLCFARSHQHQLFYCCS